VVVVVIIVIIIIIIHFLSALVPDSVKKELLQKIKAYLVQDM
jgi:Na+-transporting methylmalonyl-CoA/oxaloacetate decarboxylase gamma subunit